MVSISDLKSRGSQIAIKEEASLQNPIHIWKTQCRVSYSKLICTKLSFWYYLPKWLLPHLLPIWKWQLGPISSGQNFRLILDSLVLFFIPIPLAKPIESSYHPHIFPDLHRNHFKPESFQYFLYGLS